jgi:RNA polymerase sigma factor (sigma-70 family)
MITNEMILKYRETKDQKVFEEIYKEYIRFRNYFLKGIVTDDLEDIYQECDLRLIKCIEMFNENAGVEFTVYLGESIKNIKNTYFRKMNKKILKNSISINTVVATNKDEELLLEDTLEDKKDYYEEFIEHDYLKELLQTLDEDDMNLIRMFYFDNMKQEQIGEVLGETQSNISKRLDAIIKRLRLRHLLNEKKKGDRR